MAPMIRKSGQKKYWLVGFRLDSLSLISLMSGLVEISSVEYTEGVVWFYLRCLDKTGVMFSKGGLRGTLIAGPPPVLPQQLLVTAFAFSPVRLGLNILS